MSRSFRWTSSRSPSSLAEPHSLWLPAMAKWTRCPCSYNLGVKRIQSIRRACSFITSRVLCHSDVQDGDTPLHLTCRSDEAEAELLAEVVSVLISQGADKELNNKARTAVCHVDRRYSVADCLSRSNIRR